MMQKLLETPVKITLIGGGDVSRDDLEWSLLRAPTLVAADGGANFAIKAGATPNLVIGDFDSITPDARSALPPETLHPIAEQDSTDFEKCLRAISAPAVLALGFLGRRLDHQLAALTVLVRFPETLCLLVGADDVAFLCPPSLTLSLPVGSRFSLFPMGPVTGESHGLQWPIGGIDFSPDGRVGTSNRVSAPEVRLSVSAQRMVVILPRSAADEALRALLAARGK